VLLNDADTILRIKRRQASGRYTTRRWQPDAERGEVVLNIPTKPNPTLPNLIQPNAIRHDAGNPTPNVPTPTQHSELNEDEHQDDMRHDVHTRRRAAGRLLTRRRHKIPNIATVILGMRQVTTLETRRRGSRRQSSRLQLQVSYIPQISTAMPLQMNMTSRRLSSRRRLRIPNQAREALERNRTRYWQIDANTTCHISPT
jgi:hypothetical protein